MRRAASSWKAGSLLMAQRVLDHWNEWGAWQLVGGVRAVRSITGKEYNIFAKEQKYFCPFG